MKWLEISVQCNGEAVDAVCELFNRHTKVGNYQGGAVVEVTGFDARGELVEPVVVVRTYLPVRPDLAEQRRQIEEGLWHLSRIHPLPEPVFRELQEQDWATAWREHFHPIRVGQRFLIVPTWLVDQVEVGPDLVPIVLNPGMAFGTGLHPSTRLCLAALERYVHPGDAMLDVGSGSGILSIAAARLGASTILALDVDPVAVTATRENSQRNGLAALIEARQGSLPEADERPEGWQVIVVNILAEVIVELLEQGMARLLAAAGRLILGGIIEPHLVEVVAALSRHGLKVRERMQEEEWITLVAALDGDAEPL